MNTNQNKTIWIILPLLVIIIFIVALVLIYSNKDAAPTPEDTKTAEERLFESMKPTGPSTITAEEQIVLDQSMRSSGGSTITAEQKEELNKSMMAAE